MEDLQGQRRRISYLQERKGIAGPDFSDYRMKEDAYPFARLLLSSKDAQETLI